MSFAHGLQPEFRFPNGLYNLCLFLGVTDHLYGEIVQYFYLYSCIAFCSYSAQCTAEYISTYDLK